MGGVVGGRRLIMGQAVNNTFVTEQLNVIKTIICCQTTLPQNAIASS
jgi:hypothetical protein